MKKSKQCFIYVSNVCEHFQIAYEALSVVIDLLQPNACFKNVSISFCLFHPCQRYLQQISNFFVVDLQVAGFRVKGSALLRLFLHLPEKCLTDTGYQSVLVWLTGNNNSSTQVRITISMKSHNVNVIVEYEFMTL